MRIVTLLAVLGSVPAIAAGTGPEAPDAAAPASTPAAASAAAPAAASEAPAPVAGADPAPAAAAPVAVPAAEEFRPPAGYKKRTRDGKQVYCRSEAPVGTRLPTEYCFTQVDLERIEKNKRSMQQDHALRTRMCTTGSACSGGG